MFTVTQLKYDLPTFAGFIDCEKAFGRVDRNKLWDVMVDRGLPQHLIRSIRILCLDTYTNNNKKLKDKR
jgi:hypothetical protein